MNTTTRKATGAATPVAQKDRSDTNVSDPWFIVPAATVTIGFLLAGWTAREYGYTGTAVIFIAAAAVIQLVLELRDRRARTGHPARMVAPVARPHGHRRGGTGADHGRRLASRHTRPLCEPVDRRIQPGAVPSVDRRHAHITKESLPWAMF